VNGDGPIRNGRRRKRSDHGIAPIGVVLLVTVAVVLAGTVATMALGAGAALSDGSTPTAMMDATAEGDRLTLTHHAGDRIDVRNLDVRIRVDGEPLVNQPPVPFFSATGFRPGPTGPFNAASDDEWTAGESASLAVASTNGPAFRPGRTVEVRLIVDGRTITTLETVVEDG